MFLNRNVVIKENFPSRYSYRDPLTGHIRPNNEHDLENYTWALKSFLSEAQTLAELNNPGIVRILSVFEANGTAYFAMEHITGLSLDYLGEKLHSTGHRYTEDELKGLLTRLLRILDYLHSRHIYHRDIKPGNNGTTETFWNTFLRPYDLPEMAGSAGRSCTDDEVRIVNVYDEGKANPDDTVPCDGKTEGEIIIKCPGKTTYCYVGNEKASKDKFADGWMYTGDVGTWDENQFITISGRKDAHDYQQGRKYLPCKNRRGYQ